MTAVYFHFSELMKNRFYVNGIIIYERKNLFLTFILVYLYIKTSHYTEKYQTVKSKIVYKII